MAKKVKTKKSPKQKPSAGTKARSARAVPTRKASRKRTVWKLHRFEQRYELAEDVRFDRKSPLKYTKDFVGSGTDDESCGYFRQLIALRSKPNWLELRGAFCELKCVAGNQSKIYRGYLLDSNFKSASTKEIGRWLGVDENKAERILTELQDVGLLEQVTLPNFDIADKPTTEANKKKKRKARKPATKKKTTSSKRSRARTSQHVRARAPLNNNGKAKTKTKAKVKATSGLTASGCKGKENDNGNNANALEGQRASQSRAALNPTASPPLPSVPCESDDGGRVVKFSRPPGSADLSKSGLFYGRRVYLALGYRYDIDSPEAAREIASFASKHDQVCSRLSGLSPPVVDEVLNRGLRESGKIAKRKANRNRGAVWNSLMDKLAAAKEREDAGVKHA